MKLSTCLQLAAAAANLTLAAATPSSSRERGIAGILHARDTCPMPVVGLKELDQNLCDQVKFDWGDDHKVKEEWTKILSKANVKSCPGHHGCPSDSSRRQLNSRGDIQGQCASDLNKCVVSASDGNYYEYDCTWGTCLGQSPWKTCRYFSDNVVNCT
ncbi:Uu.00g102360.m01.CDS01 [Anthostomella pinea]|uniref:Uu.00g102360.m01.CDS01 n=1 Tax=Anthostomella pinea TaxID=933095 RepID=A0AAI8VEB9_9PEZI|nr:Uu.00g102360.m01.CDS01 [Anthostomella pinea]